jgi:hypothetical protein
MESLVGIDSNIGKSNPIIKTFKYMKYKKYVKTQGQAGDPGSGQTQPFES